jgi:hypothetical protein
MGEASTSGKKKQNGGKGLTMKVLPIAVVKTPRIVGPCPLFDTPFSEEEETGKMARKQPKRAVKGKGKARLVEVEESSSDESAEDKVGEVEEDESEDDHETELQVAVRALSKGFAALALAQKKAVRVQRKRAAVKEEKVKANEVVAVGFSHVARCWRNTTSSEGVSCFF